MNKAYKMNQSQSNFSKGALGYSQPPLQGNQNGAPCYNQPPLQGKSNGTPCYNQPPLQRN